LFAHLWKCAPFSRTLRQNADTFPTLTCLLGEYLDPVIWICNSGVTVQIYLACACTRSSFDLTRASLTERPTPQHMGRGARAGRRIQRSLTPLCVPAQPQSPVLVNVWLDHWASTRSARASPPERPQPCGAQPGAPARRRSKTTLPSPGRFRIDLDQKELSPT
jgi:hypothetical protein